MAISRKKRLWRTISDTLTASETKALDSVPLADLNGIKYVMRVSGNGLVRILEMLVSKKGSDVSDTIYSRLGDMMNIDANAIVSGSDVELQVVNGEAFPVEIMIKKLSV